MCLLQLLLPLLCREHSIHCPQLDGLLEREGVRVRGGVRGSPLRPGLLGTHKCQLPKLTKSPAFTPPHVGALRGASGSGMSCCITVSSARETFYPAGKLLKQKSQRLPAPSTHPTHLLGSQGGSVQESALMRGRWRRGWCVLLVSLKHTFLSQAYFLLSPTLQSI